MIFTAIRNTFFITLSLLTLSASASICQEPRLSPPLSVGVEVLCNDTYLVGYDYQTDNPLWSMYGWSALPDYPAPARPTSFYVDKRLVTKDRTGSRNAYTNSGYDRGHLAPYHIAATTDANKKQANLYSNVAPQARVLNRGQWRVLEKIEETLQNTGVKWWATTGVTYNYPIHYLNAVDHKLAVPSHFWKSLALQNDDGTWVAYSFIVPNAYVRDIGNNSVTVDDLEIITGLNLWTNLVINETVNNALSELKLRLYK